MIVVHDMTPGKIKNHPQALKLKMMMKTPVLYKIPSPLVLKLGCTPESQSVLYIKLMGNFI